MITSDSETAYSQLKPYISRFNTFIDDELWQEIKLNSALVVLKKGELLIKYESLHRYSYFIVSGVFATSIILENGDKKAVWFHFDDLFRMVVAPDSYFMNEPTKYEIKAEEDSLLIRFSKKEIDLLSDKYKPFSNFYYHDVITSFIEMNEIRAYMLSHSPLQSLNYLNGKYPSFVRRLSSKNMAHFLGISPEWYSKLKRKM
ncbi:MAG: cyclic nucleotide-binding domain-containing protein [Bacteroidota bacterium]